MILGIPTKELIGKHSYYLSKMIFKKTQKNIYEAMINHGFWHGEVEITPPNAEKIYCWLTLDAIFSDTKELNNIVLMITDISKIHQSKNKL